MILENLLEAKYTSPSGKFTTFEYEQFSRSTTHKLGVHEVPGSDKPVVQDMGVSAWKYPITALFFEPNCEKKSKYFVELLCEHGTGILMHPVWGELKVQPSSISEELSTVSDIGVSTVNVEFVKVTEIEYGISNEMTALTIKSELDDISNILTSDFDTPVNPNVLGQMRLAITRFADSMRFITDKSRDAQDFLFSIYNEIDSILNDAVNSPLQAAASILTLIRTPAMLHGFISDKINNYKNYANTLKNLSVDTFSAKKTQNLFVNGVAIASVESALTGSFTNKEDALSATILITEMRDLIIEMLESSEGEVLASITEQKNSTMFYATNTDIKNRLDQVFTSVINLALVSVYSLPAKRIIVLEQDKNFIELMYELYNSFDYVDEFILDNNLMFDEFYVLRSGRKIVYYLKAE